MDLLYCKGAYSRAIDLSESVGPRASYALKNSEVFNYIIIAGSRIGRRRCLATPRTCCWCHINSIVRLFTP